ncbi:MAG TPA: elongation factor G [Gemmatimonadota bacterium]|nr:elongation factor G [Gemmatimonadota bacterium]
MAASAQEYTTDQIRNVVLLGHGGSGKTSLTDAMCYIAGSAARHGSVEDGNTVTDFTPEETDHGMSINLAVAHAPWKGAKLNLIDTPGYLDFYGDAAAGLRVADGALLVVSAVSGVEAGTEKVWEACAARGLPRLFFVSMMDRENASFEKTFGQIKEVLADGAIPVEVPIGAGDEYRGIVNLFSEKAHIYRRGGDRGEYDEVEIPEELHEGVDRYRQELIETIATTDDALLEAYLEGEELDRERVLAAMAAAMLRGEIFPIFCGSARSGWGVRAIMNKLVELLPSPDLAGPYLAEDENGQPVELAGTDDESASALVFKTTTEPHTGELSFFRVYSGTVSNGDSLANASRSGSERIAHLAIPNGRDRLDVSRLHAGDIGVVTKLKNTHTGNTLSAEGRRVRLQGIDWPEPDISVAVAAASRDEEDRLGSGLARLHEEDPTFRASFDSELGQTIARGLGELHLTVTLEKLQRKYGVEVTTEEPRIPYRETITRKAEGQGRYKKQSGGRGQYGDCWVRLTPLPHGSGYEFVDSIKGGVIPNKFIPAVDHGIQEAASRGVLAGYPVVDFQAELYDGSHHSVDSSEQAFKVAGSMAFKKVARSAGTVLLEPIMEIEVTTPEEFMGDVIGDLNGRRGRVLGIEARGHLQVVKAHVPQAELYRYSAALRSLTHGKGVHARSLHGYEKAPPDVTERVVARAQEERQAS